MNLYEQLAFVRDGPETQDLWLYILMLWDYGYGAGLFDGWALCLPEFDDNDEIIDWRGRIL